MSSNAACNPAGGDPLLTLDQAQERLQAHLVPLTETERVGVRGREALGRVLAQDLIAPIASPPFDNSAMDGYAVRSEDTVSPGITRLAVIGTAWAGRPYAGTVGPGECVRIFTGAVMPIGADAVVIQEAVAAGSDAIELTGPIPSGAWIRAAGRDLAAGRCALPAGKRLSAIDLGLIASMGIPRLSVIRRVRVGILSTGDELTPPGAALMPGTIYDSNRVAISALLQPLPVVLSDLGACPDDPETLRNTLLEAVTWNDVILTIGGASVGDADHVVPTLREIGRINFWKIAMKPGKPFLHGRIGGCHVFGLPGNPASALVACLQLVRPGLLRLAGALPEPPLRLPAVCIKALKKSTDRMEFQRGIYRLEPDGTLTVAAVGGQDADRLAAFSAANCLIVLPAENRGTGVGDRVLIEPFTSTG